MRDPRASTTRLTVGLCVLCLSGGAQTARAQAVPEQTGAVQTGAGVTSQQSPPGATAPGARRGRRARPTLGLDQGYLDLDTPDFRVKLVKASQTIAALEPKAAGGFDFTPADQLQGRAADGYFHLGDLTFRLRTNGEGDWRSYSTARARKPVTALPASGPVLAAADLAPTLPDRCPLQVTRRWEVGEGRLLLRFDLKNRSAEPVEIGGLGVPMIFNNDLTRRSLEQAHGTCSFSDPAIGMDGGYIQVTRLTGQGPALVVVEEGRTPLEAYNPLLDDPTPRSQTFEGFYEWMVHSRAWAENEWKGAQPWNAPTAETLAPGASRSIGLKFLVAPEIRDVERTLAANDRPVAVGVPGYVLPMDVEARLFLRHARNVASVKVEPEGAISVRGDEPTKGGWQAYTLRGRSWGRSRLTITYDDGLVQTISYHVIKPAAQAVSDLGRFLFTRQWFTDAGDPFHRSPSVMTYDRQHDRIVTQDARVWIAGLQDEGGAGSWLAAAMKLSGQPAPEEVQKFEQFVDGVLWGGIQYKDGPRKFGVRKSLFYYDRNELAGYYDPSIRYGGWTSWSRRDAERVDRAYNYPHVVAAYWTMYRLARNNAGLVARHPWEWYLERAYQTTKFLTGRGEKGRDNVGYLGTGLMEGDIFVMLVQDLKREGWSEKAADIEAQMKARADRWNQEAFPFGSEMAWDSTGQEEVFAWTKYFGYDAKARVSLDSILGYMPTVPHWGYNGNARRYWDFLYGAAPGPTSRIERQIHHYGSAINAIPVLASYREHPEDFYLLRVGYGGTLGALSNIDADGFGSAAFHAWPSTLRWDHYSGDYGTSFFGHAVGTATYLVDHPELGWLAFGGNVEASGDRVKLTPLDSFRTRVYLAPLGLWLTLDSGTFEGVELDARTRAVRVGLSAATPSTPQARLRIEQPAKVAGVGVYRPGAPLAVEREAWCIPLGAGAATWVELTDGS